MNKHDLSMTLDPETLAFVEQMEQFPMPPPEGMSIADYRAMTEQFVHAGDPTPIGSVAEFEIAGPAGPVPVRLYKPEGAGPFPVIVFSHGGGFVLCRFDNHDELCRELVRESGLALVAVDYRRSPEVKFPGPLEDVYAAIEWASQQGGEHGLDPGRIAVCGDSAGGNLAAAVAQVARDRGGPALFHQMLLYPMIDARAVGDPEHYVRGLFRPSLEWSWQQYLSDDDERDLPHVSPDKAADLAGLAPATMITADLDPLRTEGEAYGWRLVETVPGSVVRRYDGVAHGFLTHTDEGGKAAAALRFIGLRLRQAAAAAGGS